MRTLYQILGLPQGANEQQVKVAFRRLARRFHPDVNAGDQTAEQRFKEVNQAYETLADPATRAVYDRALVCRQVGTRRRLWSLVGTASVTFALTTSTLFLAVWWRTGPHQSVLPPARGIESIPGTPIQQGTPRNEEVKAEGGSTVGALSQVRRRGSGWITYQNARFSFALKYPADVFAIDTGTASDNIRTFQTTDGEALLRIFANENITGVTPAKYRRSLIEGRYAGVALDRTPQRKFWFVLSGMRGDKVFYERVIFSCDTKAIHGWQIIYPSSERTIYDLVVDEIQRNYTHSGRGGARCGGG
jgi:curved DNA-binding protein CbpA